MSECQYFRMNAGGVTFECRWMGDPSRIGCQPSRTLGFCERCKKAGEPSEDNPELARWYTICLLARLTLGEHRHITHRTVIERLLERGVPVQTIWRRFMEAHGNGLPVDGMIADAKAAGLEFDKAILANAANDAFWGQAELGIAKVAAIAKALGFESELAAMLTLQGGQQ